jgi:diguanylate cyclase (GGDEF)-like protein
MPELLLDALLQAPPRRGLMAFQWEISGDGGQWFTWVGQGCTDLLGVEPAELMADAARFWQLVDADDRTPLKLAQLRARANGGALDHICRITTASGEAKLIQIVASPLPPAPSLWSAFALDISDQQRRHEELAQLHQLLQQQQESGQQLQQQQARALAEAHAALARLATLDGATGLPNRLHFEHSLMRSVSLAQRHGRPLVLLLLKLRGLRQINAQHGYLAGDQRLQAFASLLQASLRQGDTAGRLGGSEFAVLLPESEASDARQVLATLRAAFAASDLLSSPALALAHGVADCLADDSADQLLLRADTALAACADPAATKGHASPA